MHHSSVSSRRVLRLALCRASSVAVLAWTLAGCGSSELQPFGGGGFVAGQSGGAGGHAASDGGLPAGTGGTSSTGGADFGSGGAIGSGGRGSATGGKMAATGGKGGTGAGGTGSGTGGRAATGGTPASGGVSGTGGSGVDSAKCDQIASDYLKEMPNAKECTVDPNLVQCQIEVPSSLPCRSGCTTYVQSPATLNDLAQKWSNERCDTINRICPAIACLAPQPGGCALTGSNPKPQCQNRAILQN